MLIDEYEVKFVVATCQVFIDLMTFGYQVYFIPSLLDVLEKAEMVLYLDISQFSDALLVILAKSRNKIAKYEVFIVLMTFDIDITYISSL